VELIVIAAMSRNRVIGSKGSIPWHVPADLHQFKKATMGHAVIMGRKTYESIGRPLVGRRTVVVSRDPGCTTGCCEVAGSVEEALALLAGESLVFVAGGGEIYRHALRLADQVRLTVLDLEAQGDTYFPELPVALFSLVRQEQFAGPPSFTVQYYERRPLGADAEAFGVRVECYSGYMGEETPRRFRLGSRRVGVEKILDRWLAPDHRYFKVLGDDRAYYILRHDVQSGRWEMQLYSKKR